MFDSEGQRRPLGGQPGLAAQDAGWETSRVSIPVDEIGYLVAVFEAYENCFLVRTETRGLGILRVWYPKEFSPLFDRLIAELQFEFPVDVLMKSSGMAGLDEVFPE